MLEWFTSSKETGVTLPKIFKRGKKRKKEKPNIGPFEGKINWLPFYFFSILKESRMHHKMREFVSVLLLVVSNNMKESSRKQINFRKKILPSFREQSEVCAFDWKILLMPPKGVNFTSVWILFSPPIMYWTREVIGLQPAPLSPEHSCAGNT